MTWRKGFWEGRSVPLQLIYKHNYNNDVCKDTVCDDAQKSTNSTESMTVEVKCYL